MFRTRRILLGLAALLLLCALIPAACAEVSTLGVYLTGVRTAEDGSTVTERLEGSFRVLQNGVDIGTVDAGKTTVTLTDTERVRLVPLPYSISPEWDLSSAYVEVNAEPGTNVVVPVTVTLFDPGAAKAAEETFAVPAAETAPAAATGNSGETEIAAALPAATIKTQVSAVQATFAPVIPDPTPTLPPVDLTALSSPQPDLTSLYISGTCWFDEKADGLYDHDEPTLPGVHIELDGIKNGMHYETVSGANGYWCIDGIQPAAYELTVTAPQGMMFARVSNHNGVRSIITKDGVGRASKRIDLNDKESKRNQCIGFNWTSQITGRCFLDANYNGMYDPGELPMPGVKVTAIKQFKDEEVAVTYSGEDGTFVLTGLRGNTYKMRAVLPDDGSDFSRAVDDPLGNHFKARPGRRENFWTDFVLTEAQNRQMNVGVIYPGSITGTVYMDNDFSASLTGSEKIVSGFLVVLKDRNGETIAMDKTSVKGKYELTEVPPGEYTLSVSALKGYAFTKLGDGNVILNLTGGEGYSEPFYLNLGEKMTGMDIGMIQPGTVEGYVFADRNDNGVQDAGENGLPGVNVRLKSEDGEEYFSATVGENGQYLFDAVMPGKYYIEYELPEGAVFARVVNGGNEITGYGGTGRSDAFDFATGAWVHGPACGALTLGRIAGDAYHDHEGDGIPDAGDEPLAGFEITLTPTRTELEPVTFMTGLDGRFALEELRPDTYTLTVRCPDDMVLSRAEQIRLPLTAGRASQDVTLTVAMGESWEDQHLGGVIPASLKGQLWLDVNNNGLFDEGEITPSGYEVTVTDEVTGRVFDTLETDEEGRFESRGMIPGSFTVSFPLDENTIPARSGDSVFTEINGTAAIQGIRLAEGEERSGLLLGILRYTAIGGSVWIDRGDRVEALTGAEIRLTDGEGNVLQTQTTGSDGTYLFGKLMPGYFGIEASMPEGCVIIEPGDRRLDGNQISVITQAVNREGTADPFELRMGEDRRQMNIGCVLPGRMGDWCWLDLDGDGLQGMDEPGIPNVIVELVRDGSVLAEAVSDQYGFYRFEDIYPGVYTLRVTPPSEVRPTKRRTDIRIIASVLGEEGDTSFETSEIQVESDKANYNADLGFICRRDGVLPPGTGEGKTQDWTGLAGSDR